MDAESLFDRPVRERNGTEFTYEGTEQGLLVNIRRGSAQQVTAVLEWMFGAAVLAITPVGRHNGEYFEHRVSWYTSPRRPGVTMGHGGAPPSSPAAALGHRPGSETIFRCFSCHATGVKPGPDLSKMLPGVQCERCHGPGQSHAANPASANIRNWTGAAAAASVAMCAECHRAPPELPSVRPPEQLDPVSVRFAPVGLRASKCFQASGRLSCVTCHDPHGGTRRADAAYEEKCAGCHGVSTEVISRCPRAQNTSCLGCHMRKSTPVPYLTFTDHRIRVYSAGESRPDR